MPKFDIHQRRVFSTAANLYGDPATWIPAAGGDQMTAQVLFRDPSELQGFGRKGQHLSGLPEFEPDATIIEYKGGDFDGLFESVSKKVKEYIHYGGKRWFVKKIIKKFDGQTLYASVQES